MCVFVCLSNIFSTLVTWKQNLKLFLTFFIFTEDAEAENIFTFQDNFPAPDPVYDYPESLRNNSMPLVIDNG